MCAEKKVFEDISRLLDLVGILKMSLPGYCLYTLTLFALLEKQEWPPSDEPDRRLSVKMQSIRQMLKRLSSADEPSTWSVQEFVNLFIPDCKA